jgi:hypothetical protein
MPLLGVPKENDAHINSYRALHLPSAMLFIQSVNQVKPTATHHKVHRSLGVISSDVRTTKGRPGIPNIFS